jgi:hypothetical protein
MEAGLKEVGAAILAGLVLGIVLDFLYTNGSTKGWFAGSIGTSNGSSLPANQGGAQGSPSSGLPPPVTC